MKNDHRQKLHLEPRRGWLNDPNGLCFFKGEYHVYFQYSPDSAYGKGDKCWGHWVGKDLISWRFTGIVLRPDSPDDRSGAYSGCGLPIGDTLHIFYTGNVKENGNYDYITSGRGANVIHVSTANGHDMSQKRTLLRNSDYPKHLSCHVRDPKVWEEDGHYRMVLGARTLDDKGCVLFYTSNDLFNWELEKEFSVPDFGYMWECPDVIEINGVKYLGISPQGLAHGEFCNQNVYSAGYFYNNNFEEWDYGFDFYAPQTFTAHDGRKLMIGWMGIGDIPYSNPTAERGWQHCLTVPREITAADDGMLLQQPARELELLRRDGASFKDGDTVKSALPFEIDGKTTGESFRITFGKYLELCRSRGIFTMRFSDNTVGCGRTVRKARLDKCDSIRIIADTSSVEVYLDGGRKVLSTRFYPETTDTEIFFSGVCGTLYSLNGMEVIFDE